MPLSEASQPLYHRVYRELSKEIESGGLRPGDRLPSERWLCDELGVSRATVRRAIEELISDGLVQTRGRGSYVGGDALVEPPNTLMSLSELGRSRGLEATSRVLAADLRAATIDEAEAFGIAPGAELFELRRVRMLDGLPISVDHNRVPLRLIPDAALIDFTSASYSESTARGTRPRARTTSWRRARQAGRKRSISGWRRVRRSCSRRRSRSARTGGSSISVARCTGPIATGSRRRSCVGRTR
jgi:GntR family transcriptional regulator